MSFKQEGKHIDCIYIDTDKHRPLCNGAMAVKSSVICKTYVTTIIHLPSTRVTNNRNIVVNTKLSRRRVSVKYNEMKRSVLVLFDF